MKTVRVFFLSLAFLGLLPGLNFVPRTAVRSGDIEVVLGDDVDIDNVGDSGKVMGDKDNGTLVQGFNSWLERYKRVVSFVFGFATLSMFVVFMFSVMGIAAHSTSPRERSAYISRTLICFVVFGILGSITLVFSIAFDVFR